MKLIAMAALLLPITAAAEAPPSPSRAPIAAEAGPMPNALATKAGCTPLVRQVAGEEREHRGTRLDQQPPAQLLLAVDRQVNGCREATIVRRDVGRPR